MLSLGRSSSRTASHIQASGQCWSATELLELAWLNEMALRCNSSAGVELAAVQMSFQAERRQSALSFHNRFPAKQHEGLYAFASGRHDTAG